MTDRRHDTNDPEGRRKAPLPLSPGGLVRGPTRVRVNPGDRFVPLDRLRGLGRHERSN